MSFDVAVVTDASVTRTKMGVADEEQASTGEQYVCTQHLCTGA